jgi:Na+/melibiose symporter-like transporter
MLMLFDGLASLAVVSYQALLPNKYKSREERTKISAFIESISIVGLMLGFILPPLIIVYGNPSSYVTMAVVCGMMLFISVILGIPGLREEKELIDSYFIYEEKQEPFFKSLFEMIKKSLSQKNFRAILFSYIGVSVYNLLFVASVPYYIAYVIKGTAALELMLYVPYLLAIVIPIPFYYWLSKKFGHLKVVIFAGFALPTILIIFLFFYTNLIAVIILVALMGMSNGMLSIAYIPLYGDFFDESAVLNKKRQEGVYYGMMTFFGRTTYILQLIVFWFIHELTGFNPEATEQTSLAQFGIILHFLAIPAIALFIGFILFVRMCNLKPEKVKQIKEQLKELNL